MTTLDGSVAIVTGASRGIGKQIAIELGRRGAAVVVAARTVERRMRLPGTIGETVAAIEDAGGRALAVATDLRDPAGVEHLVETACGAFGPVDVLVNNAADTSGGSPGVVELSMDDWRRQFDVNLHAPLLLIKAVVPSMSARRRGIIVNLTSGAADLVAVDDPVPGADHVRIGVRLAYAASKAALNRLANALAPELRDLGIAIVNVDPGFTRTELVDLMGEQGFVDAEAAVPMDLPTRTVLHVVTAESPMLFTGQILRASDFWSLLP